MKGIGSRLAKYKHALLLLYYPIMFYQFQWLEKRNAQVSHFIQSPLDDFIPFVSVFVVPYVFWFAYVALTLLITGLKDRDEFIRVLMSLYIGMTFCNLIYFLFPHGQLLRVPLTENEPYLFDRLVYFIYSKDTPTNCAPSIHVLFSIACTVGIQRTNCFKNMPWIKISSHVLNVLIVLSTMFIKQHSIYDVILGLIFSLCIYLFVYHIDWPLIWENIVSRLNTKRQAADQI